MEKFLHYGLICLTEQLKPKDGLGTSGDSLPLIQHIESKEWQSNETGNSLASQVVPRPSSTKNASVVLFFELSPCFYGQFE